MTRINKTIDVPDIPFTFDFPLTLRAVGDGERWEIVDACEHFVAETLNQEMAIYIRELLTEVDGDA